MCLFRKKDPEEETEKPISGKVTSFEKVTLHISGMRCIYDIEVIPGSPDAEITRYQTRYRDGKDEKIKVGKAYMKEEDFISLLNRCEVLKWNGFHGAHPRGVLDGTMFRFEGVFNGGVTVRADGSQNFPKHFYEFRDPLEDALYEAEKAEE